MSPSPGPVVASRYETGTLKNFESQRDVFEWDRVTVYGAVTAGLAGRPWHELVELATSNLVLGEEAVLEDFLADSLPTDADTITAESVLDFVVEAEGVQGSSYGSVGVIHMDRATAARGLEENALEVKGNRLQTKLGTPAVAGWGYPPGMAFLTPTLYGYRSDVFTLDDLTPASASDLSTNTANVLVERNWVVGYDSTLPVYLANLT